MIKVKLRKRPITGNRQSLYLDFYPPIPNPKTGKLTRREVLNLYIYDEIRHISKTIINKSGNPQTEYSVETVKKHKNGHVVYVPKKRALTPTEKAHNKETLFMAEMIRQKREVELNRPEIYSDFEIKQLEKKEKGKLSFVDYFEKLARGKKKTTGNSWQSALSYLKDWCGGDLKFNELTESKCEDFKKYLLKTPSRKSEKFKLSQNSAGSYFNKFKAALKQAYIDDIIDNDLGRKIKPIKTAETKREFLTIEEINLLIKTECHSPLLKKAAIFSALTGLRFSDIQALTWDQIEYSKKSGAVIKFRQRKTNGIEYLQISDQAYEMLGEPKKTNEPVFEGLIYSSYQNTLLLKWVMAAGITKKITFHSFRHTFATLQLTLGTDLYTISKLLGHRDIKTTQIYAKVINEKKREAVNKLQVDIEHYR